MENSQKVSTAEWNRYINESISDLYDLLLEVQTTETFLKSTTVAMVAGQTDYNLAISDFYFLRAVDADLGNGQYRPLTAYDFRDRNIDVVLSDWDLYRPRPQYYLYGAAAETGYTHTLAFNSYPTGGQTVRLWYIPHAPVLTDDAHVWDGFNGWEEYVVVDAALKGLEKEQNPDTAALEKRKAKLERRIAGLAGRRVAEPVFVTDRDF